MTCLLLISRRAGGPSVRRAAALVLATVLVLGSTAWSVQADDRHRDDHRGGDHRHDDGHRRWNDGAYYPAPPVIYGSPNYYPAPVVVEPGFGLNINLR